jgi:hypothetical protein
VVADVPWWTDGQAAGAVLTGRGVAGAVHRHKRIMKSTIFARPSLKTFLLGAVLIVVIQHLINDGFSQGVGLTEATLGRTGEAPAAVEQIISQAGQVPASHVYAQLSDYYEERGDYRKALRYLRLAHLVAETEEEN